MFFFCQDWQPRCTKKKTPEKIKDATTLTKQLELAVDGAIIQCEITLDDVCISLLLLPNLKKTKQTKSNNKLKKVIENLISY